MERRSLRAVARAHCPLQRAVQATAFHAVAGASEGMVEQRRSARSRNALPLRLHRADGRRPTALPRARKSAARSGAEFAAEEITPPTSPRSQTARTGGGPG